MSKLKLTWNNFDFYTTLCPKHGYLFTTKRWVVWPVFRRYTARCGTNGCPLFVTAHTLKGLIKKWERAVEASLRPKA